MQAHQVAHGDARGEISGHSSRRCDVVLRVGLWGDRSGKGALAWSQRSCLELLVFATLATCPTSEICLEVCILLMI